MSQDKIPTPTTQAPLPPVFAKSFVGIWKRMFVSGRPDNGRTFLFFNKNGSFFGPIGPGSRPGGGSVVKLVPEPNYHQKGVISIQSRQCIDWNYTLNQNNGFKAEFRPSPTNRTPPVLNELLLVGQGVRQLYAFVSYPIRPIMTEKDLMQLNP